MWKILKRGLQIYKCWDFFTKLVSIIVIGFFGALPSAGADFLGHDVIEVFTIGFIFLTCYILIFLSVIGVLAKPTPIPGPSWIERHKPWGIAWDFEGFLGSNWKQGENVYVFVFQAKGTNKYSKPVQIKEVNIRSDKTGESIPVLIRTDKGYVEPEKANPIPSKATFRMQSLFYDPKTRQDGDREGLPEDIFLQDFGEFTLNISHERGDFSKKFNKYHVEAEINRVRPPSNPPPRVTSRVKEESTP